MYLGVDWSVMVLIWIVCGLACIFIAQSKGAKNLVSWFLVGLLFGPIGIILALVGAKPPASTYPASQAVPWPGNPAWQPPQPSAPLHWPGATGSQQAGQLTIGQPAVPQDQSAFCPRCGRSRVGAFRFCQGCGFDFEAQQV